MIIPPRYTLKIIDFEGYIESTQNLMLELRREQPKPWWSECGTVHWGKLNPAKKEVHNGTSKTGSGARDGGYARPLRESGGATSGWKPRGHRNRRLGSSGKYRS